MFFQYSGYSWSAEGPLFRAEILNFLRELKKKNLITVHRRPKSDDTFREEKVRHNDKINTILDKISKSGYESLTEKEKEYLFKNSKKN